MYLILLSLIPLYFLLLRPLLTIIYNIYFHPLASFPGPLLHTSTQIPSTLSLLRGSIGRDILTLHARYGPILRFAPNELLFSSPQALRDIYTRNAGSGELLPKDPTAYTKPPGGVHSILTVISDADHARYRRLLSHAFSERALREQEGVLERYVGLFVERLREVSLAGVGEGRVGGDVWGGEVDLVEWFNWLSFDVIGDLTLGESFGCLQDTKSHPWVAYLMKVFKSSAFLAAARRYPILTPLLIQFIPKEIIKGRMQHAQFTKEKVEKRMAAGSERADFMSGVLRHNDKETGMTTAEIIPTFGILLLAGSETTATLLSATMFYLLSNPACYTLLTTEIRTAFKSEDEITVTSVSKLKYLLAVLDETMRIHPPTPRGGPRVVGGKGARIDGVWVPGGTIVTVATFSTNHSPLNWTDPETFAPERWLDDPKYANDKRGAFQPFSLGPRNCIGKNLAYAEMRLITTRLLWNYDMQLVDGSKRWAGDMKMYLLWEKEPLMVRLKERSWL